MSRYYRRTEPRLRENLGAGLVAGGLAAGVAAVTFYLVRVLLAREPLISPPPRGTPGEAMGAPEGPAEPPDGKGRG